MKVEMIRICLVYKTPSKVQLFPIYDHREFSQKKLPILAASLLVITPTPTLKLLAPTLH